MRNKYLYLGIDKHGFTYFLKGKYVFQWFPFRDYFVNGKNMIGQPNGLLCSLSAWENSLYKIIKSR